MYYIEILFSPSSPRSTFQLPEEYTQIEISLPQLLRCACAHQSLGGVKGTGLGREFSWDVVSKKAGADS